MIFERIRLGVVLLAVALLAACAAPTTRVILLPQADGSASAVVVRANDDAEQTLSLPYQRATVVSGTRGAPVVDQADATKLRQANASLFEMLPPPAETFTVYFDAGGAVLTAASRITLDKALNLALGRSGGELVLTGHTDTVGSTTRNDDLSRLRAQQVRDLFVARNFPAQRIEVVGRGERDLAVRTADEVDEPRNRRVTIEVR